MSISRRAALSTDASIAPAAGDGREVFVDVDEEYPASSSRK